MSNGETAEGDKIMMHQRYEGEDYVTPTMCEMHHKVMEAQLEVLRQKDKSLEDRMTGIEKRLDAMDEKIDAILQNQTNLALSTKQFQTDVIKYALWIAIVVMATLVGVLTGRAVDFGWLMGV